MKKIQGHIVVDEGQVEKVIENIKRSEKIPEIEKTLLLKFADECYSQGLAHGRVLWYLARLKVIPSRFADKHFQCMDRDDIKCLVGKLEKYNYTEWTKQGFKVAIKKFFQWLDGYEWNSREYPEKVKWIRTTARSDRNKRPRILSKDEIMRLIKAASKIRDKALIAVLYESGCREGELLGLKLRDVEFGDNEAKITVSGKTGCRRLLLISSVPHLANWIAYYPNKKDPDSPLWINVGTKNHGKTMEYQAFRKMLRETARLAEVDKPVNPHNFRKSRATHLANKLTEAQMCAYFGWVQGSNMPSQYVFLSGRDIDNTIRRIHGRLSGDEEKVEDELKPIKCPRCDSENPSEAEICKKCGSSLDLKTAMEREERKNEFLTGVITPEIIEKLIEEKVKQILEASTRQVKKEKELTV